MSEGTDEAAGWRRVSPLTVAAQCLRALASAVVPAAAIMFGAGSGNEELDGVMEFALPALVLLGVIIVFSAWLGWVRLRYRIGSSDVRLEQGLISRSARSVPFERIQDVSLEQKLVPRLLGLVEVRFETGAGGKDELKLSYVSEAEGERLRETVRALAEGSTTGADANAPAKVPQQARETEELLFAMSASRVLAFGVFEFSLVVFAVLAGAAQQFEFLLPRDLWETEFWEERFAGSGTWLARLDVAARVIGALAALGMLVVVGFVTGIVRTMLRDYGFRLERTARGFRRRRGLVTRTDVVMPVHRVQALDLSTGLVRRRFGWHGLAFISLAQDSGSANHDVAPFAKLDEIEPIARAAGFDLPSQAAAWRRPSPRYYTDRAVLRMILPTVAAIGAILLGQVLAGLAFAALAALLVLREFWMWRYDRHAFDPHQVLSRRGWLAPRLQIASRVKLHSVEIAQGPLGRWRGYADLRFGLAGGRLTLRGLELEDAAKLRSAVLDSIAAVDFTRLAAGGAHEKGSGIAPEPLVSFS